MKALAAFVLLLTACLPPARAQQTAIAPKVDYHQHLLSPMGAELVNKVAPTVNLPPELHKILDFHEAHWNDKAGLAPLYTRDGFVVSNADAGVQQGREQAAAFIGGRFRGPYRMRPVVFNLAADFANVAGYFERGEGAAARPFGYFDIGLARSGPTDWQIASEMLTFPGPTIEEPETAKDLIAALDAAGISKAVVLSDAYFFDSPRLTPEAGSYEKVRAENDWTAAQVAQFPERLVAFCSLNPLSDYAIGELQRCAASGKFRGLKLHFGVSGVDLKNPVHVTKVRAVVVEANRLRLPIIAHVRASPTDYGAEQAHTLLNRIVSAAPDVCFTIAHLWGGEAYSADALAVYADAVRAHDPHTDKLYFDIAEMDLVAGDSPQTMKQIVSRMREIGLDRILYGTDGPISESQTPRDGWAKTLATTPLTAAEFAVIANNVAPYLRSPSDRKHINR